MSSCKIKKSYTIAGYDLYHIYHDIYHGIWHGPYHMVGALILLVAGVKMRTPPSLPSLFDSY